MGDIAWRVPPASRHPALGSRSGLIKLHAMDSTGVICTGLPTRSRTGRTSARRQARGARREEEAAARTRLRICSCECRGRTSARPRLSTERMLRPWDPPNVPLRPFVPHCGSHCEPSHITDGVSTMARWGVCYALHFLQPRSDAAERILPRGHVGRLRSGVCATQFPYQILRNS